MDWRKLKSSTGVELRGKVVHWEQVEGEVGQLLQQHFDPYNRQYRLERAFEMQSVIQQHTGLHGLTADSMGMLSPRKAYLQFVCSDSRVVPTVLQPEEHFIIASAIAGESLGGAFSYKQIVDLLPSLDGIVIESHTQCGACNAANAAEQGQEFDGSLHELTSNVVGDIEKNLHQQVQHIIDRVGRELIRQNQVSVFGVHNDIMAPLDKPTHTIVEDTLESNDQSLPEVKEAIDVYREIIAKPRDKVHTPAADSQHPAVLWLAGLTLFGQFRRGIGSEHELMNEDRKGLIFKVVWQNPHDASAIASARYILDHGDSVKQIVFTAASARDLWWDIETFVNNPELANYMEKNPGTELIGIILDDNGLSLNERVIKMWSVDGGKEV